MRANEGEQEVAAPRPHQPCQPDDLAGPYRERDVVQPVLAVSPRVGDGERLDAQQLARTRRHGGELRGWHVAPDHQAHQLRRGEPLRRARDDAMAIAHHRHPVGQRQHVVELVGDVHHAGAARGEGSDELFEAGLLAGAECRRRFIHDEAARLEREGAGDGDELAVAGRKGGDAGGG